MKSLSEMFRDAGTVRVNTGNAPAAEVRKLWLDLTEEQEAQLDEASAQEYTEQSSLSPEGRKRQTKEMTAALTRAALR